MLVALLVSLPATVRASLLDPCDSARGASVGCAGIVVAQGAAESERQRELESPDSRQHELDNSGYQRRQQELEQGSQRQRDLESPDRRQRELDTPGADDEDDDRDE
jgi:hypothetical protein